MISVIIAAKNASKYIKEAIESVKKQNVVDMEIIVVCDSCSDNTKQIFLISVKPEMQDLKKPKANTFYMLIPMML